MVFTFNDIMWDFFFSFRFSWTLKLNEDNDLGLSCMCYGGNVWVPREVSQLWWLTCKGQQIVRRCSFWEMSGYLWRGGRQRGRSWRSMVCGRSTSKATHTTQCPGLMNIRLRVACPWPKTPRWGCDPEKETAKTRNKRLQVHVGGVLNSVWSPPAVGILWSYFHWNASSALQGHLRHWISNPVGAFHPLRWLCLQYVE